MLAVLRRFGEAEKLGMDEVIVDGACKPVIWHSKRCFQDSKSQVHFPLQSRKRSTAGSQEAQLLPPGLVTSTEARYRPVLKHELQIFLILIRQGTS